MGAQEKNLKLSDDDLEKVSGGYDCEPGVFQDVICENGHEFQIDMNAFYYGLIDNLVCPVCHSTYILRKD